VGRLTVTTAWPWQPPLVPGRDLARDWARHELADPVYAKARPGLVQRVIGWLLHQLDRITPHASALASPRTGVVLLVLLAVVVGAAVLLRRGRLRNAPSLEPDVFGGAVLDAAGHRRLADEAARDGRWEDAVRERFRAVVRGLEERLVVDERAGRTADEAAAEAGRALPALGTDLAAAARVFDDVSYGGRRARPEHDAALRRLDDAMRAARPSVRGAAPDAAVPA
jgi:hypothetical protein